MALLNLFGFESGTTAEFFGTSGTLSVQSSVVRSGAYALRTNPTTTGNGLGLFGGLTTAGAESNSVTLSHATFAYCAALLPASNGEPIAQAFASAGLKLEVRVNSDGTLSVYDSTVALVATTTASVSLDTWYNIKIWSTTSASPSDYEVGLYADDGTHIETLSGTASQGSSAFATLRLGKCQNRNGNSVDFFYDDVYVSNSGFPATFGRVLLKKVNEAGNYTAWRDSTGSSQGLFSDIDEVPSDDDTSYIVSTTTVGDKSSFTLESNATAGISSDRFYGYKAFTSGKRDGGTNGAWFPLVRSGTRDRTPTTGSTSTTAYQVRSYLGEADPNTGELFLPDALDAFEIGVQNNNANPSRCSSATLFVYADTATAPRKTVVLLASDSSPWTVPSDFTSDNEVHCIGGGGGSCQGTGSGEHNAGGGAAWSVKYDVTWTPSGTVAFGIGAAGSNSTTSPTAGGDTWIGGSDFATSDCGAKGGGAATTSVGGTGGASGSCIGDAAFSGGNGGTSGTSGGGGGGAAAGPSGGGGNGGNGGSSGAAGGGGANGGANASNSSTSSGTAGGNNRFGFGQGTINGNAGFAGGGGAGCNGGSAIAGGNGSLAGIWQDNSGGANDGLVVGPGSGGGGGPGATTSSRNGGDGGGYGSSGGSAGSNSTTAGTSQPGLIVIVYTPSASGDVTANPTGVGAAGAVGATSISGGAVTNPTGVSGTGSVGSVTVTTSLDASASVTGVSATGSLGSITITGGASLTPSGTSATGNIGSVSLSGDASLIPTGVSATGSLGSVTVETGADATVNLTGLEATGGVGTASISGAAGVNPTGTSATGNVGSPAVAGSAIVSPSGVQATGSVGSPNVAGDASLNLSGVSANASVGTVTVDTAGNVTVNLTGVSASGLAGSPSVAGGASLTLSGVQASGAAGTPDIAIGASASVTGLAATGQIGGVAVSTGGNVSVDLTGVSATGSAGTPTPSGAANVSMSGVSAAASLGSVGVTIPFTTPPGRTYTVPAEGREYAVPAEDRSYAVPAQTRTYSLAA